MKTIASILAATMLFTGCVTQNNGHQCVGVLDQKQPGVTYSLSYWNLFVAFIFSETIIVPIVVILKDLECPE